MKRFKILSLLTGFFSLYVLAPCVAQSDEGEIFKIVEQMPTFPGCAESDNPRLCSREKILAFVQENLEYPEAARNKGTKGKVIVKFIVNEDGTLANADVMRDIGDGCGDAALALVEKMNALPEKWTPGKQRGRAVKVEYTLPVKFSFEAKSKMKPEVNETSASPTTKETSAPPPPPQPGTPEIFKVVEQMPMFPGCEDVEGTYKEIQACSDEKMLEYVYKNLKYPAEARERGTEGMVVLQYVVTENGELEDIKIIRDIGDGCGEAARKIVESMNDLPKRWVSGKQRGRPVKVLYTFPVKFKLQDDKTPEVSDDLPDSQASSKTKKFKVVDQMPRFPGCENLQGENKEKKRCADEKMLHYIYKTLKYPKAARKKNVEGTAVISFLVMPDGSLSDIKIMRDLDQGCGEAAADVVRSMNEMPERWTPGMQEGKPVEVKYTLPVKFKL